MNHDTQSQSSTESFEWLLDQFRRYSRNEISWISVRTTLARADELLARMKDPEGMVNVGICNGCGQDIFQPKEIVQSATQDES